LQSLDGFLNFEQVATFRSKAAKNMLNLVHFPALRSTLVLPTMNIARLKRVSATHTRRGSEMNPSLPSLDLVVRITTASYSA
ncbi:hypothetical protein PMAYCL1PPCAC_01398, partial [Pristionchus mayeri]